MKNTKEEYENWMMSFADKTLKNAFYDIVDICAYFSSLGNEGDIQEFINDERFKFIIEHFESILEFSKISIGHAETYACISAMLHVTRKELEYKVSDMPYKDAIFELKCLENAEDVIDALTFSEIEELKNNENFISYYDSKIKDYNKVLEATKKIKEATNTLVKQIDAIKAQKISDKGEDIFKSMLSNFTVNKNQDKQEKEDEKIEKETDEVPKWLLKK